MKTYRFAFGLVLAAAVALPVLSVADSSAKPCPGHKWPPPIVDRVVQIASLDRLMAGGYDGTTTVAQIQRSSNFGIGTFLGLDGEMIMLDGVTYQAPSSGGLRVATPLEIIPFATLTRFRPEQTFRRTTPLPDYAALQAFLNTSMPDQTEVLAIKIHGTFRALKLRSPQKQVPPYPTLTEALKTQAIFNLTNVTGTFVGFRFPAYFGTVNSAGYHFHFVSDDRSVGGHVLELAASSIHVAVETVEQYDLSLGPAD